MDVYCSSCNEPWDTFHLQHDEIFEADVTEEEAEAWQSLPPAQQLNSEYRNKFAALGWEFGRTVLNVVRCPACPEEAGPDPERLAVKSALEDLLGDDLDGLAATFNDHRL